MWSPTQYIWAWQVLIPSVKTEVCFLISVSTPTPIGTWYDQTYWRWTTHKHTCNIFLLFGSVRLTNRCGHAEWHLQTTSCKVCFLISVSTPTPIGTQHDHSWQKPHITCYIKVRVNFQVKAHQSLNTTLWHFQNCCCFLCLLTTLMHSDLSLQALHVQVVPTCMVTLGWQWLIPDHWFTQRSTNHPPVIGTG